MADTHFQDAFDEHVQRMRADLLELHAQQVQGLQGENDTLRVENERLRGAVQFKVEDGVALLDPVPCRSGPICNSRPPSQPIIVELDDGMPVDNAALYTENAETGMQETSNADALNRWKELVISLSQTSMGHGLAMSAVITDLPSRKITHREDFTDHLSQLLKKDRDKAMTLASAGWSALVSPPWSLKRLVFDMLSLALVAYDVVMLPLLLAFGRAVETPGTEAIDYVTAIFWSIDLPTQFFVGFYNSLSFLEMRPLHTARKYLQGWCLFDITVLTLDWIFLLSKAEDSIVKAGRAGKTFRALRCLRALQLVRLRKLKKLGALLKGKVGSEGGLILVRFLKLGSIILVINHAIGCAWYALGNSSAKDGWTQEPDVFSKPLSYKYVTSLHWSLTQFTPASMEVFPENFRERIFAIATVLFGLVAFSSIVSSMTSLMVQVRNLGTDRFEREVRLRTFLQDNKISSELTQQIWGTLNVGALSYDARVNEGQVQLLQYLPESLKIEMHAEMFLPAICGHTFFHDLAHSDLHMAYRICHKTMSHKSIPSGHEHFCKGEVATAMSFIDSGVMRYSSHHMRGKFHQKEQQSSDVLILTETMWVCEAALWTKWVHCGYLVARTVCEIFNIYADKFHQEIGKTHVVVTRYQAYFNDYMLDEGTGFNLGVSDFFGDMSQIEEMSMRAMRGVHPSKLQASASVLLPTTDTAVGSVLFMLGMSSRPRSSSNQQLQEKDSFRRAGSTSANTQGDVKA